MWKSSASSWFYYKKYPFTFCKISLTLKLVYIGYFSTSIFCFGSRPCFHFQVKVRTSRVCSFQCFPTTSPLGIVEQINKNFEVPRKILNVPRNCGNFFSAIGSTGVISVRYQLLLCFVIIFTVKVSSVGKSLWSLWSTVMVSDANVYSWEDRSATFSGTSWFWSDDGSRSKFRIVVF